jgi:hypothetical protein
MDVIHVWPGDHDLDNGSDATGTTISVNNVAIKGLGEDHLQSARFMNSAAAVTNLMIVTGDNISIRNVHFSQENQTDLDATFLYLNGVERVLLEYVEFTGDTGAASDVGILIGNSSTKVLINHAHIDFFQDTGLETNGITFLNMDEVYFTSNNKAMDITGGANDVGFCIFNSGFCSNTTAITTSANSDNINFTNTLFSHNTTRVVDNAAFGGLNFFDYHIAVVDEAVYPANAGTTVTTGDGAWVWTAAATNIIPATTITTPFKITGINIQAADASQTFKIHLYYGQATANISIGIFEFTVGTTARGLTVGVDLEASLPSDAIVGAKTMSSTAGTDDIDITLSYQAL